MTETTTVTKTTDLEFEAKLALFVMHAQKVIDDHYKTSFPNLSVPVLQVEKGRRYVRVWRVETTRTPEGVTVLRDSRSAHCFVDTTNGDVLKAASWKAPAKGARGNIFGDFSKSVTSTGAAYR